MVRWRRCAGALIGAKRRCHRLRAPAPSAASCLFLTQTQQPTDAAPLGAVDATDLAALQPFVRVGNGGPRCLCTKLLRALS